MKTQRNHRPVSRRPPEKSRFSKHLAEFWHDLQDEQHWKYESSSPVQILEQSDLDTCQQNNDELVRAEWFWNRRPRLLRATSCVVWLLAALGLPFWLFIIPAIGIPLLIISAVGVDNQIGAFQRWGRPDQIHIYCIVRASLKRTHTSLLVTFSCMCRLASDN